MTDAEKIDALSSLLEEILSDEYVIDSAYERGRALIDKIEYDQSDHEIDEHAEFEKWAASVNLIKDGIEQEGCGIALMAWQVRAAIGRNGR